MIIPVNLPIYAIKRKSILMIKQQTHDKLNFWRTRKKSEPQMGLEPTTLRDLVGCSNH